MTIRHALAAAVALAIAGTFPAPSGIPLLSGQSVVAAVAGGDQGCGCPLMPAVATSDHPAKGQVHGELRHTDLEAMMSNRHLRYAGDWDDALTALAHQIDPAGRYGMWDREVPAEVRPVTVVEGGLSGYLTHPAPPEIDPNGPPRRVPVQGPADSPWSYVLRGDSVMDSLIDTLTRINKYGEPAQGLRAATLAIARFVLKLDRIPPEDPKTRHIGKVGFDARATLSSVLAGARPRIPVFAIPHEDGELGLDTLDRANAALDIYRSVDEAGRESPLFEDVGRNREDDNFDTLMEIASGQSQFGSGVVPGSARDALACHAFTILIELADVRTRGAKPLREKLRGVYVNELRNWVPPATPSPLMLAARGALIISGLEDAEEAATLVDTIVDEGRRAGSHAIEPATTPGAEPLPGLSPAYIKETVRALRELAHSAGGAGRDTFRREVAADIDEAVSHLRETRPDGKYREEFMQGYSRLVDELLLAEFAGAETSGLADPGGLCRVEPGKTEGTIYLFAVLPDGLQPINHAYIGVPMIIEAQFDPPSGEAEVEFDVSFGGQVTKMTLKRFDKRGYSYRSDAFAPQFSGHYSVPNTFDPPIPGSRGER